MNKMTKDGSFALGKFTAEKSMLNILNIKNIVDYEVEVVGLKYIDNAKRKTFTLLKNN